MNEDFRARLDQLREQYTRCEGRIDSLDSIVTQLVGIAMEQNEINHAFDQRWQALTERWAAQDERWEARMAAQDERWEARMAAQDERLDRIAQLLENSLRLRGDGHERA